MEHSSARWRDRHTAAAAVLQSLPSSPVERPNGPPRSHAEFHGVQGRPYDHVRIENKHHIRIGLGLIQPSPERVGAVVGGVRVPGLAQMQGGLCGSEHVHKGLTGSKQVQGRARGLACRSTCKQGYKSQSNCIVRHRVVSILMGKAQGPPPDAQGVASRRGVHAPNCGVIGGVIRHERIDDVEHHAAGLPHAREVLGLAGEKARELARLTRGTERVGQHDALPVEVRTALRREDRMHRRRRGSSGQGPAERARGARLTRGRAVCARATAAASLTIQRCLRALL